MLKHHEGPLREALEARFEAPTLWDAFLHLLKLNGYEVPRELLERDVREAVTRRRRCSVSSSTSIAQPRPVARL